MIIHHRENISSSYNNSNYIDSDNFNENEDNDKFNKNNDNKLDYTSYNKNIISESCSFSSLIGL